MREIGVPNLLLRFPRLKYGDFVTGKLSKILYAKPSITEKEIAYILDAAKNGWGQDCNGYIDRLEKDFASFLGVSSAHATSSATGALHLGLAALGIGPEDEIILADTNWVATVAPVVNLGATPRFVDISPDTWCIDPESARQAITPKTKAIIATHLYGNLCAMDALEKIAADHNLYLIEDAAEALGSRWADGRNAGSRGIFSIFSFHGTKTASTGEGGMLASNDTALMERARMLNNHGRILDDKKQFWAHEIGYKFKMGNLQAALGCAQLERLDELVERRRNIFGYYHDALSGLGTMNPVPTNGDKYCYWMPTIVFPEATGILSDSILEAFRKNNIDGRPFFQPLSLQAHFENIDNPFSYSIPQRAVNLPAYHDMTEADQERVINILRALCGNAT